MNSTARTIAAGLNEVFLIVSGQIRPETTHVPQEVDVKTIRKSLGLSQEAFCTQFGFTIFQIRQWEQGRYEPSGAMRAYLRVIARDHVAVIRALERG